MERLSSERKKASHSNLYHRHTSCSRLLSHFNAIPFRSDKPRLSLLTYALECTSSLMRYGHTCVHNRLPNVCTSAFFIDARCLNSSFYLSEIKSNTGYVAYIDKLLWSCMCSHNGHRPNDNLQCTYRNLHNKNENNWDTYESGFDNELKFILSFLFNLFFTYFKWFVHEWFY